MKIIELVGLPGCGKSTLIENALSNTDRPYVQRNELIGMPVSSRERKSRKNRIRQISVLFFLYLKSRKKQEKKYYSRLLNLLDRLYCYQKKDNDAVLLLEEGIFQYLSSLAFDEDIAVGPGLERMIKEIISDFDIVIVDCIIPVRESAKRIRNRNKKGDRYNIVDGAVQEKLLQIKRDNIDKLLKYHKGKTYTLDLTGSVEKNTRELVGILEENS